MQVRYEREPNGMTSIIVEVPWETVDEVYQTALKDVKRHVSVPGFRRGKVPPRMVESIVGKDQILDMSKEALERKVYPEAMNQLPELLLLGEADVQLDHVAQGKPCEMTIKGLTAVVNLPELSALAVERWQAAVTDEQVEKAVGDFYREQGQAVPSDHQDVRAGDLVTFSLRIVRDGFLAGEYADDDALQIEIGANDLTPNIDDHLIGLLVDQASTFNVTYAEDYTEEDFRGQTVEFQVTVHAVERRETIEEFAARQASDHTLEGLKGELRTLMDRERESLFSQVATERAVQAAVEAATFDIPRAHLEATIMEALEADEDEDEDDDLDDEDFDDEDFDDEDDLDDEDDDLEDDEEAEPEDEAAREERIRREAEYQVKRALLLRAVLKTGQVEFKNDDLMPELTTIAMRNRIEPRVLMQRLADSGDLEEVVQIAARRKAAEYILSQAQVTEVPAPMGDEADEVDTEAPAGDLVDAAEAAPAAEEAEAKE